MWKVLLADDEPFVREGLEKLIPWKELGYELDGIYRNGKLLVEQIPEKRPDLVILDIQMPIMSGLEAARLIQEQWPEIVILLLTAYADFGYAQEAIHYHVRSYVLKSNLLEELPRELKKMTGILEQNQLFYEKRREFLGTLEESEEVLPVPPEEHFSDELIGNVNHYIEEHLAEKITLDGIADAVHMNRSYLSRVYKQKTGENLFEVINRKRIEKAREYIRQGNKKIYEIGYLIGLEDTAYFSKLFKRYEGCSPKEYENRVLAKGEKK
ncbi:MAG: response regulator [Fusicatenibacter sp.]|nr:response regulator [Fusicatenibacter sp.]